MALYARHGLYRVFLIFLMVISVCIAAIASLTMLHLGKSVETQRDGFYGNTTLTQAQISDLNNKYDKVFQYLQSQGFLKETDNIIDFAEKVEEEVPEREAQVAWRDRGYLKVMSHHIHRTDILNHEGDPIMIDKKHKFQKDHESINHDGLAENNQNDPLEAVPAMDKYPNLQMFRKGEPVILTFPWYTEDFQGCHICDARAHQFEYRGKHANLGEPFVYQLPDTCGGCWVSNHQAFEPAANAILIDNTFLQHYLRFDLGRAMGSESLNGDAYLPDLVRRPKNQYWVGWMREEASYHDNLFSLFNSSHVLSEWDQVFNLTSGYRRDADITRPFMTKDQLYYRTRFHKDGKTVKETNDVHLKKIQDNKFKHKEATLAAWATNTCDGTWATQYAKELTELGLKIDKYGKCFSRPVTSNQDLKMLRKNKFYLAFETSMHCPDFLSEKFWRNSLEYGLVPIVLGAFPKDVQEMAPLHSFIHVENFDSPGDLILYLDYLDQNDTAYMQYHAWRKDVPHSIKDPEINTPESTQLCNTCRTVKGLKEKKYPQRIVKSVAYWWWYKMHDYKCIGYKSTPRWMKEIFEPETIVNPVPEKE